MMEKVKGDYHAHEESQDEYSNSKGVTDLDFYLVFSLDDAVFRLAYLIGLQTEFSQMFLEQIKDQEPSNVVSSIAPHLC